MAKVISSIVGLPQSLWRYIKESRDELKKVSWPDRQTTLQYTSIVAVSSIVIGFITGGIDYALARILELVL